MKIKSISVGKRDRDKLVIKCEGGEYVSARIDDAYKFKVGDEISEEEAERLNRAYAKQKLKADAAKSLAHHSMSKRTLEKKLCSRGFSEEESAETADWFEKKGMLDDEKYAREVAAYYKKRGFGKRRISEELSRRGIDRETCESTLSELGGMENELLALVEKKLRSSSLDDEAMRRKLVAFLMRRGFKYEEIRKAIVDLEDMD